MKRVLILNGEGADLEDFAIRNILEYFGYCVIMCHMGRPQDYFDILGEKEKFDFDYLIIGCHGDDGKIVVPILGDDVYYPNECRKNIGFEELQGKLKVRDKTVICTGCSTGTGDLYKAFVQNNNTFIAPSDYIDGNSDLLFVIHLFHHLKNGLNLKESFNLARAMDSEAGPYNIYY